MTYSDLERKLTHYDDTDIARLRLSYSVAFRAHEGQTRKSGESYIEHPVAVANILADMGMDVETIMAGLLHDVVEDTPVTKDDLEQLFGPTVASLVDGVSKLEKIEFKSKLELQAENFRKMLLAMARDIRVIVIKLADRLHNMRTIASTSRASQIRKARETIDIYGPIARRLGMHQISDELDNLSVSILHPFRYAVIQKHLLQVTERHRTWLMDIKQHIKNRLKQHSIDLVWVQVREKRVFSVLKKMREKKCGFKEITDVYGIRICVGSTDDCYRALGVMHLTYRPFPQRIKDYIASPKPNGYQSLHTVLMGPGGLPIEIQIRTPVMHQMAEQGISAHWLYKSGGHMSVEDLQQQSWINNLLDMQRFTNNSDQFIENLKLNLDDGNSVYVFTPKGDIIELRHQATVLDFAFELSVELGIHAASARIDHELVPIYTELRSGQTVFVITDSDPKVTDAWLGMVSSLKAKKAISDFLKEKEYEQYVGLGTQLMALKLGSDLVRRMLNKPEHFLSLAQALGYHHIHEVMMQVARGACPIESICAFLGDQIPSTQGDALVLHGDEGHALHYGLCCMPIPGDEIKGVFSLNQGVTVHRIQCPQLPSMPSKLINMVWGENLLKSEFVTQISVTVLNQRGVLGLLAIAIADAKANIENIQITDSDSQYATILIDIGIHGHKHFQAVARVLKQLRQVVAIKRLEQSVHPAS